MLAYSSDLNREGTIYDGPSYVDVTKDEVIAIYDKWEEEARVIVQVISFVQLIKQLFFLTLHYFSGFKHMEKPSRWAIRAINPLKSYASRSVILLGDAV